MGLSAPSGLCGPPPSPVQTLVLGGWGSGSSLTPSGLCGPPPSPCWTGERCALYPGLTPAVSAVSGQPGQGWFALHPTAIQTATERDPGALTGSADLLCQAKGLPASCLKPRLISLIKADHQEHGSPMVSAYGHCLCVQPLPSPLTNQWAHGRVTGFSGPFSFSMRNLA